ncbi:uncharacterized protein LOC129592516 isoform X2 [Paramacrobiotus metropolitanus]|uniref:uncharacterized protein LOC129592516 isoform X2 n=1 Tax=Paramacrobiotus metropolitanus TaxID=2943436 RepID=UPI002445986B|nr:uncharacterized protein LOC129592516 isoform X2 [Paramacrobiotus metropolitanus]
MPLLFKTSGVYEWNSVDVQGPAGLLQHGKIINVVDNGLIVDFGCRGRRSQLIEYDKVFECLNSAGETYERDVEADLDTIEELKKLLRKRGTSQIQVLARTSHDEPWTWYPAKFAVRHLFHDSYVGITVQCGSTVFQEFLQVHPVRTVPSPGNLQERCIRAGQFSLRSFALPEEYWNANEDPATTALLSVLQEKSPSWHVFPVCLLGDALLYLTKSDYGILKQDGWVHLLQDAELDIKRRLSEGWTFFGLSWFPPDDYSDEELEDVETEQDPTDQESLDTLPVEILEGVFEFLDSVDRVLYRRVCSLWNEALSQKRASRDIWVSYAVCGARPTAKQTPAVIGATLWKCFTAATQQITIANAYQCDDEIALGDCLRFIRAIWDSLPHTAGHKLLVVVDRFVWNMARDFGWEISNIAEPCVNAAFAIDRIIWRDCKFSPPFPYMWEDRIPFSGVLGLKPDNQRKGLRDLLEENLPAVPVNLAALKEWIRESAQHEDHESKCLHIIEMFVRYGNPALVDFAGFTIWERAAAVLLDTR